MLTVGESEVTLGMQESERELARELYHPGYRRAKDELAAADYHANLRRARERMEHGAVDAFDGDKPAGPSARVCPANRLGQVEARS